MAARRRLQGAWREYAKNPNADLLKHAQIRLTEAGKLRPEWFWVPLLQGEIEDRQGHTETAIEHYQRAITLGAVHPAIVSRTATLLQSRNRARRCARLIAGLRSRNATLSQELEKLDIRNAERLGGSPEDLMERLERAAPDRPLITATT